MSHGTFSPEAMTSTSASPSARTGASPAVVSVGVVAGVVWAGVSSVAVSEPGWPVSEPPPQADTAAAQVSAMRERSRFMTRGGR
jgi:hypothetical protein